MKKIFVGIEGYKPLRGKYTINIYEICDQGLSWIGSAKIQYGSTRGPESEVMNRLSENGYIDKKYQGYYESNDDFKIQYIVPKTFN